jgi:ribonuclease BN (tRNA processing enzyme)
LIEVIILGSGTGVPYYPRNSSGYCIKINDTPLLFDMGAGIVRRMLEAGIDYKTTEHLFISHRHPDHTSDLIPFFFAMNYTPQYKRTTPFYLYGPDGFPEIMKKMMDIYPWMLPRHFHLEMKEMAKKTEVSGESWMVRSQPVIHGDVTAVSYRIETQGKVIAYSGDSGYCDSLIENAKDADLLIIECSFPSRLELKGVHLNTREVAEVASKAGAKKLILTHLYPFCDEEPILEEIRENFKGEVQKGEDLMKVNL